MTVEHEGLEPPVQVCVEEPRPPAEPHEARGRHALASAALAVGGPAAAWPVERVGLPAEVRHEQARAPRAVQVLAGDPHAGLLAAVGAVPHPEGEGLLAEAARGPGLPQVVRLGVVRHEEILAAVSVGIQHHHAQAEGGRGVEQARGLGDLLERPVPPAAEEAVVQGSEPLRADHHALPLPDGVGLPARGDLRRVELEVARQEEVEEAVPIPVQQGRRGVPARGGEARPGGGLDEPLPPAGEEHAHRPELRHDEVLVAVPVQVPHGEPGPPAGARGQVPGRVLTSRGEAALPRVQEHPRRRARPARAPVVHGRAVHHHEVEVPIAVEVREPDPAAVDLGDPVLARRAAAHRDLAEQRGRGVLEPWPRGGRPLGAGR